MADKPQRKGKKQSLDEQAKQLLAQKLVINKKVPLRPKDDSDSEAEPKFVEPKKKKGPTNWKFIGGVTVFLFAIITLRVLSAFYDYDYEKFTQNYEILGLTPSATLTNSEIKKAYYGLAKRWHPDKNPNCPECIEKYRYYTDAYEEITDHHEKFWTEYAAKFQPPQPKQQQQPAKPEKPKKKTTKKQRAVD